MDGHGFDLRFHTRSSFLRMSSSKSSMNELCGGSSIGGGGSGGSIHSGCSVRSSPGMGLDLTPDYVKMSDGPGKGFTPIKNKFTQLSPIQLPIGGGGRGVSSSTEIWPSASSGGTTTPTPTKPKPNLYRSNSSLNLVDNKYLMGKGQPHKLKSAYSGSSNSIEMKPNFISLLNGGMSKKSLQFSASAAAAATAGVKDSVAFGSPSSSLKLKMYKLFENKNSTAGISADHVDDVMAGPMFGNTIKINDLILFSHYDTQSILFNLANVCKLKMMLAKRRNTTTGASAASLSVSSNPSSSSSSICEFENDTGDGICNELILSCPYFRNEIGELQSTDLKPTMIKPSEVTHSISILEYNSNQTYWNNPQCVLNNCTLIEAVDEGAYYYRNYFNQKEHENWFGTDDLLGPLAISILKEELPEMNDVTPSGIEEKYIYRIIVRSSELTTLRGSILEESIKPHCNNNYHATNKVQSKDVLEYILPEIQLSCLKQGKKGPDVEKQLLKLDEQILIKKYKVGIMLCCNGQRTEEDMYNNEYSTDAFEQFLNLIGTRVRLKGWTKYNGGLDVKDDSTGTHSVYTEFNNYEIMFHVSTLLPFTSNNRQQLMRKRHIGNDIVTIVFQEPGSTPFTPKYIRSQFQHVFIIVRAIHPCTNSTKYSISVSRSKEVPKFGPNIPFKYKFSDNYEFINFLLSKVINAENATYRSEKFTTMATRTRQEYLKDLFLNYTTNVCIESKSKFSMLLQPLNLFGNGAKLKRDLLKNPNLNSIKYLKGGLCWKIFLNEMKSNYYLGISMDSLVIIDLNNKLCIFAIPTKSILGWNEDPNKSINVYYHEGENINILAQNELTVSDILERLRVVSSNGTEGIEYLLKRNSNGQFGFHIQDGGIITDIDTKSHLNKSGLMKYSKIVQICNIPVWTLKQDEMITYLKTRNNINIIVIQPLHNGMPRRGCNIQHYLYSREDEYIDYKIEPVDNNSITNKSIVQSVVPGNHRKRYDLRSLSPPRSSNSSGYGTGSSNKSSDYIFNYGQLNNAKVTSLKSNLPLSKLQPNEMYYMNQNQSQNGVNALTVLEPPPLPARTGITPLRSTHTKSVPNESSVHPIVKINQDLFERRNSYNNFNNRITRSYDQLNRFGFDKKTDCVAIDIEEKGPGNNNEEFANNEVVIKGKVTYLTEFPSDLLSNNPISSNEYLYSTKTPSSASASFSNITPIKDEQDERLKQLKSAYLKKQEKNQEDVKLRMLTPKRSAYSDIYYNDPVAIRRRPCSLQNPTQTTEMKYDLKSRLDNTVLLKDNLLKLINPELLEVNDRLASPTSSETQKETGAGNFKTDNLSKTAVLPASVEEIRKEFQPTLAAVPAVTENNLEARVTHLENELKSEKISKEILINKVHTLQEENKRLQQETYTTQESFNQFKEWLLNQC